ncbi:hypothetical protein ACJO3T_13515 [Marinobacter sp. LN3S78]
MTIFYVEYHVEPLPESGDFGSCGGAYASCWVNAESPEAATQTARSVITCMDWRIVNTELECRVVDEQWYQNEDEGLECYAQALEDGECYVFHQWPCEPQEDDTVH